MSALPPHVVTTSEPRWFLGTLVRPKLDAGHTGGRFALWEGELPRGASPPMHTHPQDETFYVLEGKVVVFIESDRYECEPGAAIFIPGAVAHSFRVESDTARFLFLSTPAGIESFVGALSEPAAWPWLQPPPDAPRVPPEQVRDAEREHAVVRVGPPPE